MGLLLENITRNVTHGCRTARTTRHGINTLRRGTACAGVGWGWPGETREPVDIWSLSPFTCHRNLSRQKSVVRVPGRGVGQKSPVKTPRQDAIAGCAWDRIYSCQSGLELPFAYPALDAWPAKLDLVEAMGTGTAVLYCNRCRTPGCWLAARDGAGAKLRSSRGTTRVWAGGGERNGCLRAQARNLLPEHPSDASAWARS